MAVKLFEVGGSVRDDFLGLSVNKKDIDFAVEANSFAEMLEFVESVSDKIFLVKEEFLTIRARHKSGMDNDFVLCRKDGPYGDSRRPDSVQPGSILDDLARRDFTINAIAREWESKDIIDPFNGINDIESRTLRCVGKATDRFNEDSLRILRAMRFAITKDLTVSNSIKSIFRDSNWAGKLLNVSEDRIRQELDRCFRFSTSKTFKFLSETLDSSFIDVLFEGTDIWLKPTVEKA